MIALGLARWACDVDIAEIGLQYTTAPIKKFRDVCNSLTLETTISSLNLNRVIPGRVCRRGGRERGIPLLAPAYLRNLS